MGDRGQRQRAADTSEQVARQIQQLVSGLGLTPGDRIGREEDLAGQFGVSRPTLREALRILSSAHLVQAVKGPGGGVFVAATPQDAMAISVSTLIGSMVRSGSIGIEDLLETRMMVEVPLAGLAALRADPDDVVRLRGLVDDLEAAASDPSAFTAIEAQIHRTVAVLAGNRVASALAAWIADVLVPAVLDRVAPAVVESVLIDQLRDLVAAIDRGDSAAAEGAMRVHLVYAMDLVSLVSSVAGAGAGAATATASQPRPRSITS